MLQLISSEDGLVMQYCLGWKQGIKAASNEMSGEFNLDSRSVCTASNVMIASTQETKLCGRVADCPVKVL